MPEKATDFKVKANDFIFNFDKEEIIKADIVKKNPTAYNIIQDHLSVDAQIIEVDYSNKKITVSINGESFLVEIKDELDQMLEIMGFGYIPNKHIKEIKAPMPGLVLEITVAEGEAVKEGAKLMILEAMKMENSIIIPVEAIIKKINVSKGQAVEKGQVLLELE